MVFGFWITLHSTKLCEWVREKLKDSKQGPPPSLDCADTIILKHAIGQAARCLREGFTGEAVGLLTTALEDVEQCQ